VFGCLGDEFPVVKAVVLKQTSNITHVKGHKIAAEAVLDKDVIRFEVTVADLLSHYLDSLDLLGVICS